MSSMLEQAIVDAKALKEAAIKNAESAIIEKYSQEIKTTVETILHEAPEEPEYKALDTPERPEDMASPEEHAGSEVLQLDLGDLEELARSSTKDGIDMEEMLTHENLSDDVEAADSTPEPSGDVGNIDEEVDLANLFEGDEEIEISQEQLKDIVEKLTLDFHPEKTG